MEKMDNSFLQYTSDILAATESKLSGYKIVEIFNGYAMDYNRKIPYDKTPLEAPNKRTALRDNLAAFEAKEQFNIIKELCDLSIFENDDKVNELRIKLYQRYGRYAEVKFSDTELIQKTKHWLADYPDSLKQYESALKKYEGRIFERNTLDDMRLSLELLVKSILGNDKSLENQINLLGSFLKTHGVSTELRSMVTEIINYYSRFQNNHVKHNDKVNETEIEYVIELTSVLMKLLIKVKGENSNGQT